MNKDGSQQSPPLPSCQGPANDHPGTLFIVGTPIGHPQDLSIRARQVLSGVSLIAAEHPALTQDLLHHHGIAGTITSYGPTRVREKVSVLAERLGTGQDIALVVDSGMPVVCDPGSLLVAEARARGIPIVLVPGPSIVTAALSVSGYPGDRFQFAGTIPRRRPSRTRFLTTLLVNPDPAVFLCEVTQLSSIVNQLKSLAPARALTIVADLTKPTETVFQGIARTLGSRLPILSRDAEVTVVLGPKGATGRNGSRSTPRRRDGG